MIQRQTATLRNIPRTASRQDTVALRFGHYWQRLSQSRSRAWNDPCRAEQSVLSEIHFQFRRAPEPGDAAIVNRIVEDLSRGTLRG